MRSHGRGGVLLESVKIDRLILLSNAFSLYRLSERKSRTTSDDESIYIVTKYPNCLKWLEPSPNLTKPCWVSGYIGESKIGESRAVKSEQHRVKTKRRLLKVKCVLSGTDVHYLRERERERERVHFTKNVVIQVTMKLCSHLNIQIARNDSKLRQIWRGRVRSLVILENHTQQRIKSEQTEDEKVRVLSGTGVESQVVCDPSFLGTVRRRRERHAHSEGISIISGWQRYNY